MKLIVGLGNPGEEYSTARHNAGFMVADKLAALNGIKFKPNRLFKALTGEGVIEKERCYLAKPQTFMNFSGHSVRSIINWLKIDLSEFLLIIDDVALPFGNIRIRPKGSDAGHKGLRSIIDCLGMNEFSRMRVGVMGRRAVKDLPKYVLSGFTKTEQKQLPCILEYSLSACECWIREGIAAAMNKYNSRKTS